MRLWECSSSVLVAPVAAKLPWQWGTRRRFKTPQITVLFFLNKYPLGCCNHLVNFQSSDIVESAIFASFFGFCYWFCGGAKFWSSSLPFLLFSISFWGVVVSVLEGTYSFLLSCWIYAHKYFLIFSILLMYQGLFHLSFFMFIVCVFLSWSKRGLSILLPLSKYHLLGSVVICCFPISDFIDFGSLLVPSFWFLWGCICFSIF